MANWQENTTDFEQIKQGSPSSYWSYGLQKRLDLTAKHIVFSGKKILDAGCGLGEFLDKFKALGAQSYGIEVDPKKVALIKDPEIKKNAQVAPAEKLPFDDATFDLVFSHETLEHVDDDYKAVKEGLRVLKSGGKMIVFCPNRLWPFETHGIFKNGKYHFGNKFGVTYLPDNMYKKLTPHVRNYRSSELLDLFAKSGYKYSVQIHSHVFPGFDGLVARMGFVGKIARKILDAAESTPLHHFGISHFLIVEKS